MATITVTEWNGGRLTNGAFHDYSTEIVRIAAAFDAEKIPVSAAVAELRTTNATLADFINESRISDKTATIARLDAQRDALFRALYNAADAIASAGETTGIFSHATHLANVMSPYKGAYSHSLTKETDEIGGLQIDLEKSATVNALKDTGLYKIAGTLFEVNASFKAIYHSRTDEAGEKKAARDGETTASLRKRAAALVVEIIGTVNALNRLSPDADTASAAQKLDAIVAQYKSVATSRKSSKKDDPEPENASATAS